MQAGETAKVRIFIDTDRSDNPMQSEIACHIGSKGNYPCRRCEIGGSQKEKESDAGYESFFWYVQNIHDQNYLTVAGRRAGSLVNSAQLQTLSVL